jgi:anti-anti-sigma factor
VPLTLKSRFVGNVYVIQCVGAIVLGAEAAVLEAALEARSVEFARFVLNLEELNRLDSIGMGLLVRYADRLGRRGGGVRLAVPPAFVTKLLEMTLLSGLLLQYPTEDAAIVSFLKQGSELAAQGKRGPRVLMFDPSPDVCIFVRTVLTRHGFDVRSTCLLHDAKVLLKVDGVEYILVGPGASQLSSETMVKSLQALSPSAGVLQLDEGFKSRDAAEATEELLQMFGAGREL